VAVKVTTFDVISASRYAFAAVTVGVPVTTSVEEASDGVKGDVCVFPELSVTEIPSGTPNHEYLKSSPAWIWRICCCNHTIGIAAYQSSYH
jgi:hypothetical protein